MIHRLKLFLLNLFKKESSPHKHALSFATGIYVAFSPFPGGHTIILLALHRLLNLNFPILFFASSFNNPWTMIPFYMLDYKAGYWFLHQWLGWNPQWEISWLTNKIGVGKICCWSFLIGGNLLGVVSAIISYFFIRFVYRWISIKLPQSNVNTPL